MARKKIESHDEYLKVVEQYTDYKAGTYQSMTLKEKMDFFDGVHTDNVPLFDEDGDDMDTSDDYEAIRDEFLDHPEQFALEHILDFMEMLDDSCCQPSFMNTIIKIIHNIVRFYQLEGITYLLSHLNRVPRRGYEYGLFWCVRYLICDEDVYPLVKQSLEQLSSDDREFVLQILEGKDMPAKLGNETERNRIVELEDIIFRLSDVDLIRKIREDSDLSDLLSDVCDVEIFPEFKVPEDEFGHITYNISGKTFGREANGSEFILLEDRSIGYWGSEGRCGRIADNLQEFFELMVNCPYWTDYLWEDAYEDEEELREFAQEIFEEHADNISECEFDLPEAQQELADRLKIEKKMDVVGILMRFYHSAKREPRFLFTYTEDDGSTHSGTGSVFDS